MRVLFATTANVGHVGPMIPLARACQDARIEVLVAAPASFAKQVVTAGFDAYALGEPPEDEVAAALAPVMNGHLSREESNLIMVRDVFGRLRGGAALPRMREVVESWRPDLVVREPAEISSLIAAEAAGVPHVQTGIGLRETLRLLLGLISQSFDHFEADAGMSADALRSAAAHAPLYSVVPELFDRDTTGLLEPRTIHRFRDLPGIDDEPDALPAWGEPDAPLVYVTFGTRGTPPVRKAHRDVLAALAALDARVLLATGPGGEPEELRPWPRNAHVAALPPASIMRTARVVITHGGFGTTMAALASGAPQVVIPLFASDQWLNASRVQSIGLGKALIADPPPWELLARTVRDLLDERSAADAAREVQREMVTLPPPEAMVMRLQSDAAAA